MLGIGKRKALGHCPCGGLFPPLGQGSAATGLPTTPLRFLVSDAAGKVTVLGATANAVPYNDAAGHPANGGTLTYQDVNGVLGVTGPNASINIQATGVGTPTLDLFSGAANGSAITLQNGATKVNTISVSSANKFAVNLDAATDFALSPIANSNALVIPAAGRVLVNKNTDDGVNQFQVTGAGAFSGLLNSSAGYRAPATAAPGNGYSFVGDTTTAWGWHLAGQLAAYASGAEVLRISNGRIDAMGGIIGPSSAAGVIASGNGGTYDVGFSRLGAAAFGLGNAAAGNTSGSLKLTALRVVPLTVATLPAGAAGDEAFVSDALGPVFGANVVGGGAVQVPVYFDVAWKVG